MADYVIKRLDEAPDVLGDYPGEMRMMSDPLGAEKAAFTWRRMPSQTGGKGSYGHRHKDAEEIYFVAEGRLQFKLEDDVVDVDAGTVVRVPPQVARSIWNEEPEDAVVIIVSNRVADNSDDVEIVPDFWPDE
jgi:mannose-6-phosphate isomerase-like protein (cupin superfamily)